MVPFRAICFRNSAVKPLRQLPALEKSAQRWSLSCRCICAHGKSFNWLIFDVVPQAGFEPAKTRLLRPLAVPICISHQGKYLFEFSLRERLLKEGFGRGIGNRTRIDRVKAGCSSQLSYTPKGFRDLVEFRFDSRLCLFCIIHLMNDWRTVGDLNP